MNEVYTSPLLFLSFSIPLTDAALLVVTLIITQYYGTMPPMRAQRKDAFRTKASIKKRDRERQRVQRAA